MAALSPNSRHRSRLIREMSRDLNRTNQSVASSTGSNHGTVSTDSTMTNFDPDNDEAIISTHQLGNNFSQKLPELRDTAKKYATWAPQPKQEYVVNTSAIGRAFPDFSQGGSSDDSMSIEVGRGAKTRQRTPSRIPRTEYSDNIDSPVVKVGDFQILSTPQRVQLKTSILQDALRNSARKEKTTKRVSAAQKENIPPGGQMSARASPYVSHASRTSSGERRTLAELHAKVTEESDGSFIGDERPAAVTFQAKNTRFSSAQTRVPFPPSVSSKKQHYTAPLAEAIRTASETPLKSQRKAQTNHTTNSITPNPTQQSFLLPNIPDISELVSGTFKDGMPVFTRGGKVHSRFYSGSSGGTPSHFVFDPVDSVPVPEDEKDIYLSIELLQDRVAQLEMEKADAQRVANELQKDNFQLQAEKKELERSKYSDSALDMAESGNDAGSERNSRDLIAERTRLVGQAASLQNLLNAAERKVSTQELRLKTNTAERDQAVQQLAQAFFLSEQLKAENEALRQENASLKDQLSQFVSESEENARKWQKRESVLREKIQRRDEVVKEVREMTQEIYQTTHDINISLKSTAAPARKGKLNLYHTADDRDLASEVVAKAQQQRQEIKSASKGSALGRRSSDHLSDVKPVESQIRAQSRSRSRRGSEILEAQTRDIHLQTSNQEAKFNKAIDVDDEGSFDETTSIHQAVADATKNEVSATEGSEYASILGEGFMANLREQLRAAKLEQLERFATRPDAPQENTIQKVQSARSSLAPSVKGLTGILKNNSVPNQEELTGRFSLKSVKSAGLGQEDRTSRSGISHRRRHSENSIHTSDNRRRLTEIDDITSAFIIPDISFNVHSIIADHPVLSASARRVLDGLCKHDGKNCTVCNRVASFDIKTGINTNKQTVHIEKPIPVSDRMPSPARYEDEPTIRPAVEPGLALATVIKALEDEVSHLKMSHARVLAKYNNHDSSLGMRQRKALKKHVEDLLRSIDVKSDQVYALYDVLEGQKQSGQEMTEKDIEVTLLSIGVDPEELGKGLQNDGQKNDDEQRDGGDDDVSELDLPWEGIDDTTGSIGGNKRKQAWRF